jgi:hypothetical protein
MSQLTRLDFTNRRQGSNRPLRHPDHPDHLRPTARLYTVVGV